MIELETNKEKLEKEKLNVKIITEDKEHNNKEFERLLEKFDRYRWNHLSDSTFYFPTRNL